MKLKQEISLLQVTRRSRVSCARGKVPGVVALLAVWMVCTCAQISFPSLGPRTGQSKGGAWGAPVRKQPCCQGWAPPSEVPRWL